MSWGFAEGQAVFASDEAMYDSYLDVPGVTSVASTGDHGAADPEYPAFSPDVVAVGGTSRTLNADNSYNSETGWGYCSSSAGALIGSGGGISLYEPEPAYQQGVQSTGYRTTPDVSLVADPATGAWIADPYNLDPSNPFEVVGGTSLSAPAWAGLIALVNQGRAAAGESALNSTTPTDAQQALYMLPQSDYNVITSGNNGYAASAGYNLVTGLGTPVANLLVPDLIAYQGPGTSYAGSTVAPLQDSGLVNSGTTDSGPMDVFSVFDFLAITGDGRGDGQRQVYGTDLNTSVNATLLPAGAGRGLATTLVATGFASGPATNYSAAGLAPSPSTGVAFNSVSTGLTTQQPGWSTAHGIVDAPTGFEHDLVTQPTHLGSVPGPVLTKRGAVFVPDSVLDELAVEAVLGRSRALPAEPDSILDDLAAGAASLRGRTEAGAIDIRALPPADVAVAPIAADSVPDQDRPRQPAGFLTRLAAALLVNGLCGHGKGIFAARKPRPSGPSRRF
jgi:hypothetical protein